MILILVSPQNRAHPSVTITLRARHELIKRRSSRFYDAETSAGTLNLKGKGSEIKMVKNKSFSPQKRALRGIFIVMCNSARICIAFLALTAVGYTYEYIDPLEKFEFTSSVDGYPKASQLLHSYAIKNNLSYEDASLKFPSGTTFVSFQAERTDGLKVTLTGTSDMQTLSVSIYCEITCNEWRQVFGEIRSDFESHFAIVAE
jgi:hypothetical protein